jgi:hypothetical protein
MISQPEFVDMDAYNQLHFPGFPSGGLVSFAVSYACYFYSSSLGVTVRNDLQVRVMTPISTFTVNTGNSKAFSHRMLGPR